MLNFYWLSSLFLFFIILGLTNAATTRRKNAGTNICQPSPCGANTKCENMNDVPICSCLSGYFGNPLSGCNAVDDCSTCGIGAICKNTTSGRAICECPNGYIGNPFNECRTGCINDSDCPSERPNCFYGNCKNPCDDSCGTNAICKLRGSTAVCTCPPGMAGNPFDKCTSFTSTINLCEPNPCGANTVCTQGRDRSTRLQPVCACKIGYLGNPLYGCVLGNCSDNKDCADNEACINSECQNACTGKCLTAAKCVATEHNAVCTVDLNLSFLLEV